MYYFVFQSVLILRCRSPEDGGLPPKYVAVNKKTGIVMCIRWANVGFINEEFGIS